MWRRIPRKHPLLTRITSYLFVFATLVSILTSCLQLIITYQAEKNRIIERLDAIGDAQLNTLANNVWSLDKQAIEIQLNDISGIPDIVYVNLQYGEERPYTYGSPQTDCPQSLQRKDNLERIVKGKKITFGTLTVQATTKNIQDRLLLDSARTLAVHILTIFFTCLFVLFLFLFMFNRYINQIVKFTETLEIGHLDEELVLTRCKRKGSRPDELDRIVMALNNMQERLRKGLAAQLSAEQNLIREKLFSDAIINSLPGILFVINEERATVRCNQKFREKLLLPETDVSAAFFFDRIAEIDRQAMDQTIEHLFQQGQSAALELNIPDIKGATSPYLLTFQKLVLDNEKFLIIAGTDLTEPKKIEEQLRQAQKMESVGQLAGGVAHDFNNMLGVILGHAELAMDDMDPSLPLFLNLKEIRNAATRSADITRQLLAFARKQTVSPKVLDLNETVAGMLKMLRRLIGEDIDLVWLPGYDLWSIKMDPSQIDQILANLCVNARGAISGVGKITVETGNSTFDKDYSDNHPGFVTGEYVRISVSDDGCGMDKAILAHIFEPFFTTKDVGEGTGLGLATVYGAVKQNNGFINVYSEPGEGTIFTIYLPRHVGKIIQTQPEEAKEPALRGSETILLVEDELTILNMTTVMLHRLGYTVLAAATPTEAIRLASELGVEIHLLLSDVIMPNMNGRDLAERLLKSRPGMKCLFMSGYTANIIASQGLLDDGVSFVQKPFSIKELATKIRKGLENEKERSLETG
jgi:signal transduction histidine kinase/ActR/RegA family two-component response regulator